MSREKTQIKTKGLTLHPRSEEELAAALEAESDPGMRQALGEMLQGVRRDPQRWLWWTQWLILRRQDGQSVGSLCLRGPARDHETEIGYGIDPAFQNRGYASQAAGALIDWAFEQDGELYFMTAETEADNAASRRVLEKLGFTPEGFSGQEGPRFLRERPADSQISMCLCLGMSVGLCLGAATDNLAVGMSLGMCVGVALGAAQDAKKKKQLAAAREARKRARE